MNVNPQTRAQRGFVGFNIELARPLPSTFRESRGELIPGHGWRIRDPRESFVELSPRGALGSFSEMLLRLESGKLLRGGGAQELIERHALSFGESH
jgi:hypothetical protein